MSVAYKSIGYGRLLSAGHFALLYDAFLPGIDSITLSLSIANWVGLILWL